MAHSRGGAAPNARAVRAAIRRHSDRPGPERATGVAQWRLPDPARSLSQWPASSQTGAARSSGRRPTPPEVTDLSVPPDRIRPNFDARDDITHITYRVAKDARVSAFLDAVSTTGAVRRVWMGEENTVQAGEQRLTWDGISNGQPVPSGDYSVGIRARDRGGNVVERSVPLAIDDSGVP